MLEDVDTAVSVRLHRGTGQLDLGTFSTCEGLGCEVVIESREEGGNNSFIWQLPTRLKYPNITLTGRWGGTPRKSPSGLRTWPPGTPAARASSRR